MVIIDLLLVVSEEKTSVFLWLSMLGLQGYTNTFETNGYDDVKFMVRDVFSHSSCSCIVFHREVVSLMLKTLSRWVFMRMTRGESFCYHNNQI